MTAAFTSHLSLCCCYSEITNRDYPLTFQGFLDLYHTLFDFWRCQWFKQAVEKQADERVSKQSAAKQASKQFAAKQVSKQTAERAWHRQSQVEEARTAEATHLINEVSQQTVDQQVNKQFAAEHARTASAIQAQQVSKQFTAEQTRTTEAARLAEQQQTEEAAQAAVAEAFICRRCKAHFSSNTKFHCHIRDRYAKRPTSTAATSPPKPSAAVSPVKHSATPTSLATPPSTPPSKPATIILATPSPSPTQCLANHVTKPPLRLPPPASSSAYLTLQDLYRMFHGRSQLVIKPMRQARITAYFKSKDSTVKLASMRKRADSSSQCQMT